MNGEWLCVVRCGVGVGVGVGAGSGSGPGGVCSKEGSGCKL